ncbi:MAG: ribosome maturation factor RimP [Candidatus Omnitrophica bacterium]|nr:ribosome maturation factor RimP [Candidatus Omnitrophota bacterium]
MEIIERVRELVSGYLRQNDTELVDITYKREQQGMVLRLLVDTPAGITIDGCEAINKFLGELMDKENLIEGHYVLEVSSPGLDRPIKTDRDFERAMGQGLTVTTYEPVDGKKAFEGKLMGMDKEHNAIVIEKDGISVVIPREKIAMARLYIEV